MGWKPVLRMVGMADAVGADITVRRVMLKPLPADCLLDGEIHPNIKERLERIRQIPHSGVAALLGVQRDESGGAWLVWETIEGQSFNNAASDPRRTLRDLASLMRELALSVESFHATGLVHGAISQDNVIVDHDGRIRLT